MKEFKLDLVACIDALDRCENADEDSDEGGEPAGAVLDELSRQLTAAGAPPGDLETQLRALLARPAPIEPGADVIERLLPIFNKARGGFIGPHGFSMGIRAVVVALAEMGAEQQPDQEFVKALGRALKELWIEDECAPEWSKMARVAIEMNRQRLAPVLGARRALEAAPPTDEQLAEEASRLYRSPKLDDVPGTYWEWYTAGAQRKGRQ